MDNQPADPGGTPGGPEPGDVRFSAGGLETFDGTEWVPLQRVSDDQAPPVFRHDRRLEEPATPDRTDDDHGPSS
jgi:hypothetical protein